MTEMIRHMAGGVREGLAAFAKSIEEMNGPQQFFMTVGMWLVSHLSTLTAVVALVVLLFNLKVAYYKAKREEMQYRKECLGEKKK